jgi:branched-subunit amino acid aminotransferase/4-amino-4-deoxychorismate lyase
LVSGVFETVRLEPAGVRLLSSHLARAVRCGVPERLADDARAALAALLPAAPLVVRLEFADGGLRVTRRAVPDRSSSRLVLTEGYDPGNDGRERKATERGWTRAPLERAAAAGADDALLSTPEGRLGETTIANLILELGDGTLVTPPAEGLLAGVTRAFAIRELDVEERMLDAADLADARAAILSNAVRGLWAVAEIDGRPLPGSVATAGWMHARWLELPLEAP